ncbi:MULTISPECIES: septum site-determining protein MinC [unclassified Mesorhizobium]|uniref:septum site-determining protein MinC n=1 Tax=unclassified Mesorhizobium TaxID=325217 RepID=UPI0003CEE736|nr:MULTISPECIES: septum site-determining protein MinC [unclassified Mesorhizobium]ESX13909.1 septum site-determining protein MinC [Mesorhizobium sp. LSJC265A00]ESX17479.1 septum site-determining protein MinC [Mesorhizobium sp. LSJC255A00]ESX25125.1 septum site-determining protein MinC [Mesorhizobium sp. LSHC440B00]ESX36446.1 septum site-determining protein MinC [Mesorhizobium sp. LSHC432A00]ESX38162.1 septum site-determining protein MinC [Mesorhizobium sp. LSHC440A00]
MTFAAPLEAKSIRFRARSFVAFTLTPEAPLDVWLESLDRWVGNSPGYFAGRPVVLDLNVLKPDVVAIEALVDLLGQRGIRIYAMELDGGAELGTHLPPVLVGAKEATTDGLLQPSRKAGRAEEDTAVSDMKAAGDIKAEAGDLKAGDLKPASDAKAQPKDAKIAAPDAGTLMIRSPIRSGQLIFHPHGDVIVLGSVASGSEIVATGSIHVYGTLRGRASAGAQGNTAARVFCRRNEAELLSVDGWYCTAEEMDPSVRGKPVQAFLENGMLRIAPFS